MTNSFVQERKDAKIKAEEEELEKLIAEATAQNTTPTTKEVEEEVEKKKPEPKAEEDPEEDSFKKRYGDLRRHAQKEKEAKEAEIEELKEKLRNTSKGEALPASDEDLDEWKENNPKAAAIVETLATKIADAKLAEAKDKFDAIDAKSKKAEKDAQMKLILKSHPDFEEISESDEFHDWLETQPRLVQQSLYENSDDADSAIMVLDRYKDQLEAPKKKKAKEADAASEVPVKGSTKPSEETTKFDFVESEVNAMSNDEYAEKEEEIDKAISEGKFLYDMSGAAQ